MRPIHYILAIVALLCFAAFSHAGPLRDHFAAPSAGCANGQCTVPVEVTVEKTVTKTKTVAPVPKPAKATKPVAKPTPTATESPPRGELLDWAVKHPRATRFILKRIQKKLR